jgi:SPP1 gp7 family putative phage head morphogenesis protein
MIRFPEPAQKLYVERHREIQQMLDQTIADRMAQAGLRLDQAEGVPDADKAKGAIRAAAAALESMETTEVAGEVVNRAEEFYTDEVERNFREQGAQLAVSPPPIREDARKQFRKLFQRKMSDDLQTHLEFVEEIVVDGIQQGRRASDIAEDFRERIDIGERKAELAARDVLGDMQAFQSKNRLARVGVTKYRWLTAGDERVRDTHQALDGTIQRMDQPPLVGHPGEDWLCRCDMQPIIAEQENDLTG